MKHITHELFDSMLRMYDTEVWLELYTANIRGLPKHVADAHSPIIRFQYLPMAPRPIRMIPKEDGLHLHNVSFNMTPYELVVPWTSVLGLIIGDRENPEAGFHFIANARNIMKASHETATAKPASALRVIPGGSK